MGSQVVPWITAQQQSDKLTMDRDVLCACLMTERQHISACCGSWRTSWHC